MFVHWKEIDKKDILECVTVIKDIFLMIADELGCTVRYCNGFPTLWIALFTNRVNTDIEDVFKLLKFVCKQAEGT